jgi:hypothetical protein
VSSYAYFRPPSWVARKRREETLRRLRKVKRCLCGNAITREIMPACNGCLKLVPEEMLGEYFNTRTNPALADRHTAATAAIENFLRCERAHTNEVKQ